MAQALRLLHMSYEAMSDAHERMHTRARTQTSDQDTAYLEHGRKHSPKASRVRLHHLLHALLTTSLSVICLPVKWLGSACHVPLVMSCDFARRQNE